MNDAVMQPKKRETLEKMRLSELRTRPKCFELKMLDVDIKTQPIYSLSLHFTIVCTNV